MVQRVFDEVPVLCGHRGSGRGVVGGQVENTLGSFRAAVAAGVSWVEVDVRATAEGELVASHDPLEGETGELMRIADLLDDLPPQVGINLEIKTGADDALKPREETTAALTAALAREHGERRLLATSFDASAPLIFREHAPGIPIGLLTWMRFPLRQAIPAAVHLGMDVVAPHFSSLEDEAERHIGAAHEAGLQVVSWCPPPVDADRLFAAGVDCLIVDDVPAETSRLEGVFHHG